MCDTMLFKKMGRGGSIKKQKKAAASSLRGLVVNLPYLVDNHIISDNRNKKDSIIFQLFLDCD